MIKKLINNGKVINFAIIVLLLVIFVYAVTANQNIPTEEVKSVDIYSEGYEYDELGSWHINESAEWISKDKARVTFNLDNIADFEEKPKQIFLLIDVSKNMKGDKFLKLKSNVSRFINKLLENNDHKYWIRIAYSFDDGFTYGLNLGYYYGTDGRRCDNYYSNSPCYYLHLPGEDIMDVVPTGNLNYEYLVGMSSVNVYPPYDGSSKTAFDYNSIVILGDYSSKTINIDNLNLNYQQDLNTTYSFIQYDMGSNYIDDFQKLPGNHYIADKDNLYEILMNAINNTYNYDSFEISDYIDNDYFTLNSVDDIDVSMGNVDVVTEEGNQKVIWNLGDNNSTINFSKAKLTMDLSLKNEHKDSTGLFTLNDLIVVNKQEEGYNYFDNSTFTDVHVDMPIETVESDKTPVLSHSYSIEYDLNLPDDCSLSEINKENYIPYSFIDLESKSLSCTGYNFKGWSLYTKDSYESSDSELEKLDILSNNSFIMPNENIIAKANWGKISISKSTEGNVVKSSYIEPYLSSFISNNKGDSKVVFGNSCWEAIGTNENGGVKLIYYGVPGYDGSCGTNDFPHPSYSASNITDLDDNYVYGSDYRYDSDSRMFYLSGEIKEESIDENNYPDIVGKYTCKLYDQYDGCNELYYVNKYIGDYLDNTGNYAKVLILSSSDDYYSIGNTEFNDGDSLTDVGYMKDDSKYEPLIKNMDLLEFDILMSSTTESDMLISDNYIYSDDTYKLDNAVEISTLNNYSDLVGKYTFLSKDSNYQNDELYYIVEAANNTIYYIQLYDGLDKDSFTINYSYGPNINSNGDGTYTISNPSQVRNIDWVSNGTNLSDVYICPSGGSTCAHPYYVIEATATSFKYIKTYKFGNSFVYDSNTNLYTLVDTVDQYQWTTKTEYNFGNTISKLDNNGEIKHHYTCFNDTGKCENINFLVTNDTDSIQYYTLKNGQSMREYIDNLFDGTNANSADSTIKTVVDTWFKHNMLDYLEYIDDTVFCNNRNISNYGMFDKDGNYNESLYFDRGECTDVNDKFSVSNLIGNGKLTYPVGIFDYTNSGLNSWIGTSELKYIDENGLIKEESIPSALHNVRPVISLKSDVKVYSGFGTDSEPFLIKY